MRTPRLPYPSTPVEYLQAPAGGWSPDVPTWELAADQAPQLENFQIKPGKLRVRPTYRVTADLTQTHAGVAITLATAGWVAMKHGLTQLSNRIYQSSFLVEPQNIHRVGINAPSGLQVVDSTTYFVNGSTVSAATSSTMGLAPGWRAIDFNGIKYALTYASISFATLAYNNGVTGWKHSLMNITPGTPVVLAGSPQGGFDVYGWLDRVWVLGGMAETGTPPGSTTSLFFTNPLQTFTGTLADWEDPVSGLYNQIDIDGNHNDPGVALASVAAGLVLLRQNSVFILRGTDPTSYVIRPVSMQAGCLDARSVVEMDSKVYFMSEQGFMVTDGTRVQNISGSLQDELYRQIAYWKLNVYSGSGAWWTCAQMSDGKITMSSGSYAPTTNLMVGAFSAVFDPATGTWVKVSTAINPTGSIHLGPVLDGYDEVVSLGNAQMISLEDTILGLATTGNSSLHDVSTVAGAYVPITATWTTRSPQAALAGRQKIQLQSAYLDYAISTGLATGTVNLNVLDRIANTTLSTASVPVSTNASDPRQYLQRDDFHEVADAELSVSIVGGSTGSLSADKAEIHGVGIKFKPTSDLRPIV